jgi:hypothetical protein
MAKLQQLRINAPEVWVWPICAINDALLKAMATSRIVADFVDDQRLFPGTGSVKKSYTDQYQWLLSRADQVVSNSKGLISEFKKEFGQAIDLLENADLLAPGLEDHASPTASNHKKSKGERFQVGFVGNMRGRMNIPLMQELIRGYEEVDFVFVGQTHGSDFYKACAKEPNVRFMGTLPQAQADAAAQGFDLAIIPFVRDALVKSMSPIKSVTFNRLGVPTISTLVLSEAAFRKAFHEAVTAKPT